MVPRKNARTRAAQKRRDIRDNQTFRIYDQNEPRKLQNPASSALAPNYKVGIEPAKSNPAEEKAVGEMRWLGQPVSTPKVETERRPKPPEGLEAAFAKLQADYNILLAGSRAEAANKEKQEAGTDTMARNQEQEDYERIVNLTQEKELIQNELKAARDELKGLEAEGLNANNQLDKSTEELRQEREKLQSLEKEIAALKEKIVDEQAATANVQEQLTALYADVEQAHSTRQAALEARDEARIQQRVQELQFEELKEEWQETKARVTELEEMLAGLEEMDNTNAELNHDIAQLREEAADHERTIFVKDERISHLETQYQKERQRNIAGHEEQARAAAASPIDDGPQHISNIGDSLEEELRDEQFYEEGDWNDLSEINEAFAYSPIAPAQEPPRTFHPQAAAVSTSPTAPAATSALSDVRKAASTFPIAPAPAPPSTIHVRDAASTIPMPAPVPKQTLSDTHKAASTSPRAAAVPKYTISVHDAASTAPQAADVPKHGVDVRTAASTAPKEPVTAPSSLSNVHETASLAPAEPVRVPFTINKHELVTYAPKQPNSPALTMDVSEVASVPPTKRQITTANLSIQTGPPDAPALTSQLLDHATFDTALVEPPEIAAADQSMQTDAQQLAIRIFEDAVMDVSPIEPEPVEPTPTSDIKVQTETDPGTEVSVQTTAEECNTPIGTQTTRASSTNRIAPVMVTHEVTPVRPTIPEPVVTPPNTTRTTETVGIVPAASSTISKLPRVLDCLPYIIIVSLLAYSLLLWTELASWKTANGVGFGYGYGNMASRSGAYGNGRHLLGVIPIGMDVGNSWFSEQVARHMSMYIARFEDWAGLAFEPLY